MAQGYIWYVCPLDSNTNQVIARELPEENECRDKECVDGKRRDMWQCEHSDIANFERSAAQLHLRFTIFVQEGQHGKPRKWLFSERANRRVRPLTKPVAAH